jgi:hypothetical protein
LPVVLEPLEHALDKLAKNQGETRLLARLLLVIVELILVQAILRKPTALVLASGQPNTVESGIAAGALTILLFLLVWTYQSGRGLLKAVTWSALDAIPTVNPAASAPAKEETQLPTLADATLPAHR